MMTITAPDGTPVEIFASQSGEFVDTCLRATDRDTWVQAAISQNLLYQDPMIERTTDEATGEVTETIVGYEDEIKVSAGVNITEIGPIVLVPGEYDEEDGSEVKAPVMDNRFHLNMRIADRGGGVLHLCRLNEIREGCTVRKAGNFSRVELIEASCDGNKHNKKK